MINLTQLVIEYKKTKDNNTFNLIYKGLQPIIKKKTDYIYKSKWYPFNMYHPCKFCRNCNKLNNVPRSEHSIVCQECDKCTCIKGFFNLRKDNLCEYQDVENDLWTEVLRIIDDYDKTKDFNTYLVSSLWNFIPNFITKNFITSILNKSLTQQDEEEIESEIEILVEPKQNNNINLEEILKKCKTENERKICELYLKNQKLTLEEIGQELGMTKQNISLIINRLRKRLKLYLTK
jgi:RNA polymerase sigma factor (sigma-70 family)